MAADMDPNMLQALAQRLEMLEAHLVQQAADRQAQNPPASLTSKPPKPDTFSGNHDAKKVRQWVFQVDNFFTAVSEPEARRLCFVVALLRDNALLWWQSLSANERPGDWPTFAAALVEYFAPLSATIVARDTLARLVQKSSVKSYTEEFKRLLLNIPDIAEGEKLDRYRRGLKREVRLQLALTNPASFQQACIMAEQVDSVLYSNRDARSYTDNRPNRPSGHFQGATPMEIGAMKNRQSYPKLSPREKEHLIATNGCFFCRRSGHRMRDCPLRSGGQGNGQRRQ